MVSAVHAPHTRAGSARAQLRRAAADQYKQKLAAWINGTLQHNECVYQLSGYDLAVRLNTESHAARIEALDEYIKQFRFIWDGMPLQPQVGVSYCCVRSPVNHLYLLLGELSIIADLSLSTNHPESLQQRGAAHLQRSLKDKVAMMNRLQAALEGNQFVLVAQRYKPFAAIITMKFYCACRMRMAR